MDFYEAIWELAPTLRSHQKLLLLYIAYNDGELQATQTDIIVDTGLCAGSLNTAIKTLEDEGLIEIDTSTKPRTYRLTLDSHTW